LRGDIKQIAKDLKALKEEILLLRDLKHPNIVKYLCADIAPDKKAVDILLEYMPGGSVRNLLDRFGPLDEKIVKIYMKQILEGLKYLHSKGIVHRNLKCSNILVDNDATIKLSDFGASKRISFSDSNKKNKDSVATNAESMVRDEFNESLKDSAYWMAPEVIINIGHHKAADIWSVGCVMYEMRTGNPPWSELGKDPIVVLSAIAASKSGPVIPKGAFSLVGAAFMRRCFEKDPQKRPTVEDLLADSYINTQDDAGDTQARQAVKQMSTKLKEEISNKNMNLDEEEKIPKKSKKRKDSELSLNSSEIDSIVFDENLEPIKSGNDMIIINTKVSSKIQENTKKDQEELAKLKEEKRKKWEEELRKELEKQKNFQ